MPPVRLLSSLSIALLVACSDAPKAIAPPEDGGADAAAPDTSVEVVAVFDLPRTATTRALSATWFDAGTRTLFALSDRASRIVPLVADESYATWEVGEPIALTGRPGAAWDGEGLAATEDAFFAVTVETEPLLERFDRSGSYLGKVDLPARFAAQAAGNKGLESLAIAPSGRYLFTANESALVADGASATKTRGTTVRILRHPLAGGADEERAYRTEPLGAGTGGDMGISDLAAVSDGDVLVLERGYQPGYGNTVRIFRVAFESGADVSGVAALGDDAAVLDKTLVVDLATLPSDGVSHPSTQPNPILDNYEALSVGPTRADGKTLVFVTSDDNESAMQVARVLVLAVWLGR